MMKETKRSAPNVGNNDVFFQLACTKMEEAMRPCANELERDLKVLSDFRRELEEYRPIPERGLSAQRSSHPSTDHISALIQFMHNIQQHSLATAIEHLIESMARCTVFAPNVYDELIRTLEVAPGWIFYRSQNKK